MVVARESGGPAVARAFESTPDKKTSNRVIEKKNQTIRVIVKPFFVVWKNLVVCVLPGTFGNTRGVFVVFHNVPCVLGGEGTFNHPSRSFPESLPHFEQTLSPIQPTHTYTHAHNTPSLSHVAQSNCRVNVRPLMWHRWQPRQFYGVGSKQKQAFLYHTTVCTYVSMYNSAFSHVAHRMNWIMVKATPPQM